MAVETAPGESFTPEQGLSSDAVWKVLIDREGVWVATNSGLDRLRRAALTTVRLPHAQEHEFSVAAGDRGSVWTGNSSLPLTHVAADGTITSFPRTRQTISVRRDHNGTIWSAGAGELPSLAVLRRRDSRRCITRTRTWTPWFSSRSDRNNDPWITTSSGQAYHFSSGAWSDQNEALGKKPGVMGAMVDDQAGNVWFGFSNKVVEWDGSDLSPVLFP